MKGLIYRWLLATKRPFTLSMVIAFFAVICMMYLTMEETSETVFLDLASGMPLFLFSLCTTGIMMIQLFHDRTNGVEKYFLSAPVSRRKYLLTAYLFYGGAGFIISLIYLCLFVVSVYSKGGSTDPSNLLLGYITISCSVFIFVAMLLFAGLSLNRIGVIIFGIIIWGGFSVFSFIANSDQSYHPFADLMQGLYEFFTNTNSFLLSLMITVLTAAISALIAFISIKLYKRRDFR